MTGAVWGHLPYHKTGMTHTPASPSRDVQREGRPAQPDHPCPLLTWMSGEVLSEEGREDSRYRQTGTRVPPSASVLSTRVDPKGRGRRPVES